MAAKLLYVFLVASLGPICALATCTNPEVNVVSFSTRDATIVNQIEILGEFTVKCSNEESPQLFAEFEGKLTPVARIGDNKYQVKWLQFCINYKETNRILIDFYS